MKRWTDGRLAIGIFLGISATLTLGSAFGISVLFDSTSVSTLIGGVIGGAMALSAQQLSIEHQKVERSNERKNTDEVLARSALIKLIQIITNIHHIRNHFNQGIVDGRKFGYINDYFRFTRSLSGNLNPISLSELEKSLPLQWKDVELFNSLLSVDWIYNSLAESVKSYNILREELFASLGADALDGILGQTTLNEEQYSRYAPRAAGLADLHTQIVESCKTDFVDAEAALRSFAGACRSHLEMQIDLNLPDHVD